MSRTSKLTLAAAFLLSAISLPAQAQSVNKGEILAALVKSAQKGDAGAATDLRGDIEARINQIMSEMSSSAADAAGAPITIREIDEINRSAERERTTLEFEKARFERMQLELERMLALYEAAKTIEEDAKAQSDAEKADRAQALLAAQPKEVDPREGEAEGLPRVSSISGFAGVYSAEVEFDGQVPTTIRVGDEIENGFFVEDIRSSHVLLKGPASATSYRLTPKASKEVDKPSGPQTVGGVLDLSQFPMAQY